MLIGIGEDVDEGMDALGVEVKYKAEALKEANARGVFGVNERYDIQRRMRFPNARDKC